MTVRNEPALAISASDLATLLGISRRHLLALHSQGKIPSPVHLGRSVRWDVDEVRAWLAAGAPDRDRWKKMRK